MGRYKSTSGGWASVSIPKTMFAQIAKILPKIYGYTSPSEYVREAVRRKLEIDTARLDFERDEKEISE